MNEELTKQLDAIKASVQKLNAEMLSEQESYETPFSKNPELTKKLKSMSLDSLQNNLKELCKLHSTIITDKHKERDLLKYHMELDVDDKHKVDNLTDATDLANKLLKLYYKKVGGFNFEDTLWNLHDSSSEIFQIDETCVLFSNSINEDKINDVESVTFVENVTKCINKYLKSNIVASWRKIDDERRETLWFVILIRKED